MSAVLFISGPPGIGKSSVAEALSRLNKVPYFDLDQLIEQEQNIVLSKYIGQVGWTEFRRQESFQLQELVKVLSSIQHASDHSHDQDHENKTSPLIEAIVSLGGGCVLQESNRRLAREIGPIFTLWGSESLNIQRLKRRAKHNPNTHPLPFSSLTELNQLLMERLPCYLDSEAWLEVYEAESPEQIAQRIDKIWTHYQSTKIDPSITSEYTNEQAWYAPPSLDSFPKLEFDQQGSRPGIIKGDQLAEVRPDHDDLQLNTVPNTHANTDTLILNGYPIYLKSSAQDELIELLTMWLNSTDKAESYTAKLAVFSDDVVARLYGGDLVGALQNNGLQAHLISFPVGEQSKQLRVVEAISTQLLKLNFTRSDCLLALGGGVSGDLCGFVASIYLRGVSWAQVPSTLLAQIDSSIGAKTAVNHPLGKNLIGSFYRPSWVWIDDEYLKTLPLRHLKAGWVEALKHALICDPSYFGELKALNLEDYFVEQTTITQIIKRGLQIKAQIVEQDELEKSHRALLNLGHTLGHAFEKSDPTLLHGEAVALGISFTVEYSELYHHLDPQQVHQIKQCLETHELDIEWRKYINDDLFKRLAFDKKRSGAQLKFVGLKAIGSAFVDPINIEEFKKRVSNLI